MSNVADLWALCFSLWSWKLLLQRIVEKMPHLFPLKNGYKKSQRTKFLVIPPLPLPIFLILKCLLKVEYLFWEVKISPTERRSLLDWHQSNFPESIMYISKWSFRLMKVDDLDRKCFKMWHRLRELQTLSRILSYSKRIDPSHILQTNSIRR